MVNSADSGKGSMRRNDVLIPLTVIVSTVGILISIQQGMGKVIESNTLLEKRLTALEVKMELVFKDGHGITPKN